MRLLDPMRSRWRGTRGAAIDDDYLEARAITALLRQPTEPLDHARGDPSGDRLDVAVVVPPFFRGSGGHGTIANLVRGLERRGHRCSLWIDDPGQRLDVPPQTATRRFREWFGPLGAVVHHGLERWVGADVAVATGWQTVARVRTLPGAGARAYLIQDHEPEFFATGVHRRWAEHSYLHGFHAITAGIWLAGKAREYGMPVTSFELAVDRGTYRPQPIQRRSDVVMFYARATTPRRAVPVVLSALHELHRRRPDVQLWAFGHGWPPAVGFPVRQLGVLDPPALAARYAEATVGLVLSMTNYSLVAQEMLACGLPCVELRSPSVLAAFGDDGPLLLTDLEPHAIADALQQLLDDPDHRRRLTDRADRLLAQRTWDAAAARVEDGLRHALQHRTG